MDENTPYDSFSGVHTPQSLMTDYNQQSRSSVEESNQNILHHIADYSDGGYSALSNMQSPSYCSQQIQTDWSGHTMHYERIYAFNNDSHCQDYITQDQYYEFRGIPQQQEQDGNQNISFEEPHGNECHTMHYLVDQTCNTNTTIS